MNYSYILSAFLFLFSPAIVASKTMTSSSSTIASCLAEYNYGQSDCDCQYYQKSQCKPNYYNNKEGASYRPKDQGWDDTCATCCCLSDNTPEPTRNPIYSPSLSPSPISSLSSEGGDGGKSEVRPKPKEKPKPRPKPKPKPKPKPSEVSGAGGGGGSQSSSPNPSPSPAPSAKKPFPVKDKTHRPTRKPQRYPYSGEGESYSRKNNHYSLTSPVGWKQSAAALFVMGLAVAAAALLGLAVAEMIEREPASNELIIENDPVVRRRRIDLVSRFVQPRGLKEVNLLRAEMHNERILDGQA